MNKVDFYTKNIAFSAMIGCLIGMGFFAILSSGWHENLIRYGTFAITVLVSLFASAVAVGSALLNINKQQELLERRHISARAVLPLTLSRLHKQANHGFETVLATPKLRKNALDEAILAFQELEIARDDLKQLKECIEAADSETQAWLSLILAHWQREIARLESTITDKDLTTTSKQLDDQAADWLLIQAMINHVFEFSRTGIEPDYVLDTDKLHVPHSSKHYGSADLESALARLRKYCEDTDGWTTGAFRKRLESPKKQLKNLT